mgnify:CR=1 FL=1
MDNELYRLGEEVGAALKAGNLVLTTAESCTGGWIGEVVTMISGSSAWYDRGFITYTNAAKQQMLGVKAATARRCAGRAWCAHWGACSNSPVAIERLDPLAQSVSQWVAHTVRQ